MVHLDLRPANIFLTTAPSYSELDRADPQLLVQQSQAPLAAAVAPVSASFSLFSNILNAAPLSSLQGFNSSHNNSFTAGTGIAASSSGGAGAGASGKLSGGGTLNEDSGTGGVALLDESYDVRAEVERLLAERKYVLKVGDLGHCCRVDEKNAIQVFELTLSVFKSMILLCLLRLTRERSLPCHSKRFFLSPGTNYTPYLLLHLYLYFYFCFNNCTSSHHFNEYVSGGADAVLRARAHQHGGREPGPAQSRCVLPGRQRLRALPGPLPGRRGRGGHRGVAQHTVRTIRIYVCMYLKYVDVLELRKCVYMYCGQRIYDVWVLLLFAVVLADTVKHTRCKHFQHISTIVNCYPCIQQGRAP